MKEVPTSFFRYLPDVGVYLLFATVQTIAIRGFSRRYGKFGTVQGLNLPVIGSLLLSAFLTFCFVLRFMDFGKYFPAEMIGWSAGFTYAWTLIGASGIAVSWLYGRYFANRSNPPASEGTTRRAFLATSKAALLGAPPLAVGYGTFIQRNEIRMREAKIVAPQLPPELDGIRIVQLTDIHRGPFLSRNQLDRAVAMANEARPQIAAVTGDLITSGRDPMDDCLLSLSRLKADAGIFGCLGNHEMYEGVMGYVAGHGRRVGIQFLRHAAEPLKFGSSTLNLAGVDYDSHRRNYLRGAEQLIVPGAYNVLLSHNPDVFPAAAQQGYDLTISGHTHGGQIRVEVLGADLNLAYFYTPYVDGLYKNGNASAFVSRGIGTIGMPTRLGAPPEVALLHLCRT